MNDEKPLVWVGASRKELVAMPEEVCRTFGFVLGKVQNGDDDESIKPLTGRKEFKGAKVREICEDLDTNTYRAVFTVEYDEAVYVLYRFQKKSKRGKQTPGEDIERILGRLKQAEMMRPAVLKEIAAKKARNTPVQVGEK
jgi:phage-related protein